MKNDTTLLNKLINVAGSRLALNIYFWCFLFLIKVSDADDQHLHSKAFYYGTMLFFMSFLFLVTYINNWILLPKFLFLNKRLPYFIWASVSTFIIAFIYTFMVKWLPILFNDSGIAEMSVIMSPVSNDLSILGTILDMGSYFSVMVVVVTIFSLLGYYHYSVAKTKRLELLINKHRETELAFLNGQLNPHFLFNTLNNLYGLAIKKSDETPEAILQLSTILRYILYESDVERISFEKEKEIIQAYIDIELLRVKETPEVQFIIMADAAYNIPPLLWLPIIENVFKHSRDVSELEIDFKLNITQNKFHLYCKNNFVAHTQNPLGGVGLTNLQKRLALLYPQKHQLTTAIDGHYYIIELKIDL
jgi:two-component system, LytTR family, sensor kinase